MERLGHGAEIRHQPGTLRRAERDRLRGLFRIQPSQRGAGGGGGDRAEDAGRVPALAVMRAEVARHQLGPDLVAGEEGGHHVAARAAQALRLGQNGRHQHRARVAAQRNVVVVERVGGRAVDPGGFRRGRRAAGEAQRGIAGAGREHLRQDARRILAPPGDHHADAVDEAGAGDARRLVRHAVGRQVGDEVTKAAGERHGGSPGDGRPMRPAVRTDRAAAGRRVAAARRWRCPASTPPRLRCGCRGRARRCPSGRPAPAPAGAP